MSDFSIVTTPNFRFKEDKDITTESSNKIIERIFDNFKKIEYEIKSLDDRITALGG